MTDAQLAELLAQMTRLVDGPLHDTEENHVDADDILCEALRLLGQGALVDQYNKLDKWYA